jgi:trigger factor
MKLLEQRLEERQTFFKMEAEPDDIEASMERAYQKLVQKVNVPGFRKGKAPRDLLERQVGKEAMFDEAMEDLLPRTAMELVKEHKVEVYSRPQVRITQKEPLAFEVVVPMPPEIKLGDYNAIRMKPTPVEVTDETVDRVVQRLRKQAATWEPAERPSAMGDAVNLDVESNLGDKPFLNEKNTNFQLIEGMNYPAPGFNQQVVGMMKDEEKEFDLKLPDDYGDKEVAGKEVHFKIKVNEVRGEKLPELNEEFTKMIQPGFASPEVLRERIKEDLTANELEQARVSFEEKLLDEIVSKSEIAFPPILIEVELDNMVRNYYNRVAGSVQNEQEFQSIIGSTNMDKLRESYRPTAIQRVKRNMVLGKVADEEHLAVSGDEIESQIDLLCSAVNENQEERRKRLTTEEGRDSVRDYLLTRRAIELLAQKAQAE